MEKLSDEPIHTIDRVDVSVDLDSKNENFIPIAEMKKPLALLAQILSSI